MRVHPSPGRTVRSALALLLASTAAWSAVVAAPAAHATTASQLSGAQRKLHAILADIKKATAERGAIRARLSVLLAQVDATRRAMESTGAQLVDAQLRIDDLSQAIDSQQSIIDQRAVEAYMNPVSELDVVLGSASMNDLQDRMVVFDAVAISDQQLVDGLEQRRTDLQTTESRSQILEDQLRAQGAQVDASAETLTADLGQQQAVLTRLQGDLTQVRALVKRLTAARDRQLARQALNYAAQPPPIPGPPGGSMGVRALIVRDFTPLGPVNVRKALCVGFRESSYDPRAVNQSSGAAGVFQFMPSIWPPFSHSAGWGGASVFNPVANVAVAAWAVGREGWVPWRSDAATCGL